MHDSFEDIIASMVQDLGPMDVPEEPELLVTIFPETGDMIQFTVSCGIGWFRDYVSNAVRVAEFLDFTDTKGHVHIIRTSEIKHVEIEEENNGDTPAS